MHPRPFLSVSPVAGTAEAHPLSAPLGGETGRLLAALREHAPRAPGTEPGLAAAIEQAVTAPGSLVRARLVAAAAAGHGLPESLGLSLACAVEYFHAASLLFDDLPCMDDATLRRGRPCAHRVHGEATAILAALALINRAHVLVALAYAGHPPAVRVQAALLLDDTLGVAGLVGGQARDLRYGQAATGPREIARIAAAKTGALFRLVLVLPALASGPSPEEFRRLKALALYWGQWFQACDDMQDLLSNSAATGKDTGRDRPLARPNLALALGPVAVRRRLDWLGARIERTVAGLRRHGARWDYLAEFPAALARGCPGRAA